MTNTNRRRFLKGILGALAGAAGTVVLAATATAKEATSPPSTEPQPEKPADIQERRKARQGAGNDGTGGSRQRVRERGVPQRRWRRLPQRRLRERRRRRVPQRRLPQRSRRRVPQRRVPQLVGGDGRLGMGDWNSEDVHQFPIPNSHPTPLLHVRHTQSGPPSGRSNCSSCSPLRSAISIAPTATFRIEATRAAWRSRRSTALSAGSRTAVSCASRSCCCGTRANRSSSRSSGTKARPNCSAGTVPTGR